MTHDNISELIKMSSTWVKMCQDKLKRTKSYKIVENNIGHDFKAEVIREVLALEWS